LLLKYHKNSGFEHDDLLNLFILTVNKQFKTLSSHAKRRIIERIDAIEAVGVFIRDYKIDYDDIMEYTYNNGMVEKILIRANFNFSEDIIFALSYDAMILTCYLNKKSDKHYTLKKSLLQGLKI